jgi:hypothetical protein
MLDYVDERVEKHLADIEHLHLGRTFDAVILGSFLVNTTDPTQRGAFLAACAAHVSQDGVVFLQRLDPELVPLAIDASSTEDGVRYAMDDVRHEGGRFEATMSFATDSDRWEHRYAGVVIDDDELANELAGHGLCIAGYLDHQRTWVRACKAERS